ncbi:hypothetical protein [Nannocystis pusilla]|uniref:AgmX/PglI C-terminal domain-containing protein n=1 Tax=Nannocystis pusilla TaxID=889268 RepID=A0ABS7TNZ9_9BACT|nr:hypothetical protein [Nannocystis pusilla]MBZ5709962.1 hypothetical protein [Nannocystis pusilla]
MASRSFYLTGGALLAGTATALVLWSRHAPAPSAEPSPSASGPSDSRDPGALGVRAADHDPANLPADPPSERSRDTRRIGNPFQLSQRVERPARPDAPPGPPAPPVAASPGLNAESEASVAAQPKVVAALRADLDRRRDALRKSCWPQGSDAAATFTVEATYAADGTLVALGTSDVAGMPGVGTCLTGQIAQKPPTLPEPPGVPVTVAVPIAFAGSGPPPAPPTRAALMPTPSTGSR